MKIANERLVRNLGIDENFIITSTCCSLELDPNEDLDDAESEQESPRGNDAVIPTSDVTIQAGTARDE